MDAIDLRELLRQLDQKRQPPLPHRQPVVLVDVDRLESLSPDQASLLARRLPDDLRVYVGIRTNPLPPLLIGPGQLVLERLTTTLAPRTPESPRRTVPEGPTSAVSTVVRVDDPLRAAAAILEQGAATPEAVHTLDTTLRIAQRAHPRETLILESNRYTSLLNGPEYAEGRARTGTPVVGPPGTVVTEVTDAGTRITLAWATPESGLDHRLRRELAEALTEARARGARNIELRATGPDFCATPLPDDDGREKRERGAYLTRLQHHPGVAAWLVHRRLAAVVQGRCTSAGLELIAFARTVTATEDAVFSIPHVRLGLTFGAGGTVSLIRRIGRWRTAYLALTGDSVDAATALRWRLVDAVTEGEAPPEAPLPDATAHRGRERSGRPVRRAHADTP